MQLSLSILSSEAPPARASASPAIAAALPTRAATSPSPTSAPSTQLTLFGASPRTSPAGSACPTTPSDTFWADWSERMPHSFRQEDNPGQTRVWLMDPGEPQRGASAMLSISAFPNAEHVCLSSLHEVLETGVVHPRYFLSSKACAGILRRAEKRGRKLPQALQEALVAVTECPTAESAKDN